YSLLPPEATVLDALQASGVRTVAIGKISALFGGQGVDVEIKTAGNADGVAKTLEAIHEAASSGEPTFIWTNLVDFDELYGHRRDPEGYARALEAFDAALPDLEAALPSGARLLLTADHGNDPTYSGSDHTRERVPVLMLEASGEGSTSSADGAPARGRDVGTRDTFADHAATVGAFFGADWDRSGSSIG
ncbi:MAG: phosphopentomutase, partial [Bacteroidota bacterium]